ncbi:MAG TPA: phosphatase PAP2 family protein [Pseudogracilibacillus sp.]|nr:phosphatase PAP2 family protein [Pseudogracilibacillus sp.]
MKIHTQTRKKGFLITAIVFLVLFFLVTLITSGNTGFLIDEAVIFWAESITSDVLLTFMRFVSVLGSSELILLVTVAIGLVLLIKRQWRNFFFFFTVSVGGVIVNFALKVLIKRERPGDEVSYIEAFNVQLEVQSYSFPSGHTMRATILLLFLMYLTYLFVSNQLVKVGSYVVYTVLLLLIALSRVILEAHFITDVVGALFVATGWFFLILYLFHKEERAMFSFQSRRFRF